MRAADTEGSARLIDSSASRKQWQGETGTLSLEWNSSGALEIRVSEHGGEDLVDVVTVRMDELLKDAGKSLLFFDLGAMRSYDSAMRVRWTAWVKLNLAQVVSFDVAAHAKIVTMGVAVANLALGGIITSHTAREGSYEAALRRAGLSTQA